MQRQLFCNKGILGGKDLECLTQCLEHGNTNMQENKQKKYEINLTTALGK